MRSAHTKNPPGDGLRYAGLVAEVGTEPSVGGVGDSYDNVECPNDFLLRCYLEEAYALAAWPAQDPLAHYTGGFQDTLI